MDAQLHRGPPNRPLLRVFVPALCSLLAAALLTGLVVPELSGAPFLQTSMAWVRLLARPRREELGQTLGSEAAPPRSGGGRRGARRRSAPRAAPEALLRGHRRALRDTPPAAAERRGRPTAG
ncbi:unnamed protein product [Prorocentrum cordatum]|uniref:Uncharacterized protein n=1 Tax=Prorocentrum cordatum TaxID=2364126 RepID=A0ABN9TEB7_9DINO|nr:unnamed protein product [Polarella glacialis]